MARGLENLLAKIDENPRQTLVGRYLALIADIKDEDERAEHALALAERLIVPKTNEALRIAYMVYESGRHQVRALKVVIACFEQKGRAGKVAVLKMELMKLEQELGGGQAAIEPSIPMPGFRLDDLEASAVMPLGEVAGFAGQAQPQAALKPIRSDETRVADLDLVGKGHSGGEDSASDAVDLLFREPQADGGGAADLVADEASLDLAEGVLARLRGRPGDTVLPPGSSFPGPNQGGEQRSGTMISHIDLGGVPGSPQRTIRLDEIPRVTLDEAPGARAVMPDPVPPPANALSHGRGTAPSEVFDRFFAAGKFIEAEVVLESSRGDAHFEWWQLRRLKLDVARQQFHPPAASSPPPPPEPKSASEDLPKPFSGDIRKAVITEILTLAEREGMGVQTTSPQPAGLGRHRAVPLRLLAALRALPHDRADDERQLFDLLQGLFPGGGNEQVLHLLREKSLTTRSPAWFGFYLDTLLACGYARKVIAEAALMTAAWSAERPLSLAWVRVMWLRLPRAWNELGSAGFSWHEEDGTRTFAQLMAKRPRASIRHFL